MGIDFKEDDLKKVFKLLPEGLSLRLARIPLPEQFAVLKDADLPLHAMGEDMEEDDLYALDKAIRYKDSKVQLVRMMLLTRIKNEVDDAEKAEEFALYILQNHSLDQVHQAYDEIYKERILKTGSVF